MDSPIGSVFPHAMTLHLNKTLFYEFLVYMKA